MGIVLSIIVFSIGVLILGQSQIIENRQKEKQKEILLSLNKDLADFDRIPSLTATDLLTRVASDVDKQRLYIWFAEDKECNALQKPNIGMPYRLLNFAFKDLHAIALVEDGSVLSSHGAVGNIPEGATGTASAEPNKVKTLALLLIMDHAKHSFFQINFYNKPYIPLAKASPEYEALLREARKWYNKLEMVVAQPKRTPEPSYSLKDDPIPIQTFEIPQQQKSSEPVARKTEKEQPKATPPVQEDAELSYFDRIVAENRRQLRNPPSKDE